MKRQSSVIQLVLEGKGAQTISRVALCPAHHRFLRGRRRIVSANSAPVVGVHVNYQETKLRIKDGLPKMKDVPKEMGGSGVSVTE